MNTFIDRQSLSGVHVQKLAHEQYRLTLPRIRCQRISRRELAFLTINWQTGRLYPTSTMLCATRLSGFPDELFRRRHLCRTLAAYQLLTLILVTEGLTYEGDKETCRIHGDLSAE